MADDERTDDLAGAAEKRWLSYWRRNPIEAWTSAKKDRRAWFRLEDDRFLPAFSISDAVEPTLSLLVAELTDYRLAQYHARKRFGEVSAAGFVCRAISNQRDPILKLPSGREKLPDGETEVWVGSSVWQFRFAKEFCNVARPARSGTSCPTCYVGGSDRARVSPERASRSGSARVRTDSGPSPSNQASSSSRRDAASSPFPICGQLRDMRRAPSSPASFNPNA